MPEIKWAELEVSFRHFPYEIATWIAVNHPIFPSSWGGDGGWWGPTTRSGAQAAIQILLSVVQLTAFFPAFSRHLPIFSTCSHHFLEFPSHFPNIVPPFSLISPKFFQHFPILSPWFSQPSHQLPAGLEAAAEAQPPRAGPRVQDHGRDHPGGLGTIQADGISNGIMRC